MQPNFSIDLNSILKKYAISETYWSVEDALGLVLNIRKSPL